MPRTNQSLPSVCLYIRVTENGRRRYERVNRRNPQLKGGVYCLHFLRERKAQVGNRRHRSQRDARMEKESELLLDPSQPKP